MQYIPRMLQRACQMAGNRVGSSMLDPSFLLLAHRALCRPLSCQYQSANCSLSTGLQRKAMYALRHICLKVLMIGISTGQMAENAEQLQEQAIM